MRTLLTVLTVLFVLVSAGPAFAPPPAPPLPPGVVTPQSTVPPVYGPGGNLVSGNPFFPIQPFPGAGAFPDPNTGRLVPITPSTPFSGTTPSGSPTGQMMPWVGISTPQPMVGQVIRQIWVEPQIVPIQVYVRQPEGIPEVWQTQYVEVPGYWATETTQGTIYPPRWTIVNPGYGVYQWLPVSGYFQPRR